MRRTGFMISPAGWKSVEAAGITDGAGTPRRPSEPTCSSRLSMLSGRHRGHVAPPGRGDRRQAHRPRGSPTPCPQVVRAWHARGGSGDDEHRRRFPGTHYPTSCRAVSSRFSALARVITAHQPVGVVEAQAHPNSPRPQPGDRPDELVCALVRIDMRRSSVWNSRTVLPSAPPE